MELLKELENEDLLLDFDFDEILPKVGETGISNAESVDSQRDLLNQIKDQVNLELKQKTQDSKDLKILQERLKKLNDLKIISKTPFLSSTVPCAPKFSDFYDETEDWCVICNEDGVITCKDCENDLYCSSCFKLEHSEPSMKVHKSLKYVKRKLC
jgi:hypothetical protein